MEWYGTDPFVPSGWAVSERWKGAAVDSVDSIYYRTPLSWAAENGYETVVKLLIENGAAVDSVNKNGQTPLSLAAEDGHEIVVKLLIENGAVVDLADKWDLTPLSYATKNGHEAVVKLLMERSKDQRRKRGNQKSHHLEVAW